MKIIITGNPVEGFEFTGPFATQEDALRHTEQDATLGADWWLADVCRADGDVAAQLEAEREKSAELRRRILRAMSVEALANSDFPMDYDPLHAVMQDMGVHIEQDSWKAVEPHMHPLPLGTLVLSAEGECDTDDDGVSERHTGSYAVGEIVSADNYGSTEGITYGVTFGNGTHVLLEEGELADPDAYLVANSPF
jgi:hypothetical protein